MKQLFNLTDNLPVVPGQSTLLLETGSAYSAFAILNKATNEVNRLFYYEKDNEEEDQLLLMHGKHEELGNAFADVLISYCFPETVLVPAAYYTTADAKNMLQLVHNTEPWLAKEVADHVPEWHLYNVYSVPRQVIAWMNRKFHSGKYWHCHTLALNAAAAFSERGGMLVDFKTNQFSVVLAKAHQLLLAQTFVYEQPEDVLFYLLKICNQFLLVQEEVEVLLSGLVEEQSAVYRELYQYFSHLHFRDIPDAVKLPSAAENYPRHFFSSLLNLATCAS